MKKKVIIGILLMVLFWGLLWAFLIQKPDYDYGINVKFELDTPVEYEYAIAEVYAGRRAACINFFSLFESTVQI